MNFNTHPPHRCCKCSDCVEYFSDFPIDCDFKLKGDEMQRTLIILKPSENIELRNKIKEILLENFNNNNNKIVIYHEKIVLSRHQLIYLYEHVKHKNFFNEMCNLYSSSESDIFILIGDDVINRYLEIKNIIRKLIHTQKSFDNIIHSSDSIINAKKEISIIFGERVTND